MSDVHELYRERRDARAAEEAQAAARARRYSNARLVLFALGALLGWLAFARDALSPVWLLVPAAAFFACLVAHDSARRERLRRARAREVYDLGLARLEHRFAGLGRTGERHLDPDHPYAMHLDLFGRGSLYELLSRAQTRAGEDRLAAWLLAPAGPAELRARHEAVTELAPRLELREDLASLGPEVRAGVHAELLTRWGEAPAKLRGGALRWLAAAFAGATATSAVLALAGIVAPPVFYVVVGAQALFALALRTRVSAVLHDVDAPARDLEQLAALVARVEREPVAAARLVELSAAFRIEGVAASRELARLHRVVSVLDWRRNQMFALLAPLLLWGTQSAFALEAWRARCGSRLRGWLDALGELEALCDLAAHAFEHPDDTLPELVEGGPLFEARGLGHPLLPEERCVRNDLALDRGLALVVVSGSNMSGKSTLLRSVGTAVVLALAGAPVRASSLRLSPLALGASLRVQDSIQEGASRFYAELLCLRRVVALCAGPRPVLFLLDEILQGTNSHDRGIGATALVKGLVGRGAVGLITTHDLALTAMVDALAPRAKNAHFEDELRDGTLHFDYRLREGVVRRSNALELMKSVGLDVG